MGRKWHDPPDQQMNDRLELVQLILAVAFIGAAFLLTVLWWMN